MSAPRRISDANVAIDAAATPGFLGAASSDGVLRTGVSITYTDGGNFITLDVVYSNPGSGTASEHFGASSTANANYATSFGNTAVAGLTGTAVGYTATAGEECTAIGHGATAPNDSGATGGSTAIGYGAVTIDGSCAFGLTADATGYYSLAMGYQAESLGTFSVAIGPNATAASTNALAMGYNSNIGTGSSSCLAIGAAATISGGADYVACIGASSSSAYGQCLLLGAGATSTAANQAVIGSSNASITAFYIGKGVTHSAPATTVTLMGTSASNSNVAGSALVLSSGTGRGTGATHYVEIQTSPAEASGSTQQTNQARVRWKHEGEAVFNDGGLNYDHRFEGDTDANLLMIDAGVDAIGVGVATGSIVGKTHISQASTTGAKPVLTLTQKDLSEEFIRLVGESGTDASQSLVDAVDMPTPGTIQGWIRVYIQDDKASGAITDGIYYVPFYSAPT